ncbi:single-stranded nucleic acid binding protein [Pseudohyphozyma bogoriensis]|nr:single-stranded nucleic acid binding protein [Pseudohyphozyma bogoriensis]
MTNTFSQTRLYIGNLSASVDEYTLMQVCAKHGKIAKLDYLFHKTGPSKGKPRGYAFVEYATKENPEDVRQYGSASGKGRGRVADTARPTSISLLKGQGVAGASTNRKIAALEAKLNALRRTKPSEPSPEPVASTSAPTNPTESEQWLDAIVPPATESTDGVSTAGSTPKTGTPAPEGEGASTTTTTTTKPAPGEKRKAEAEEGENEPKRRQIVVDARAAGLPARPWFDAKSPPRRS